MYGVHLLQQEDQEKSGDKRVIAAQFWQLDGEIPRIATN